VEIRQLRLFVAVAEEGSIHRGARRMHMAQPPASQALRKLECAVGGPLFHRSSRGVVLTEAGLHLLEHAREILARVDGAMESVRRVAGGPANRVHLRVGLMAGVVAAGDLTWPIIGQFRRTHPEVDVEVQPLNFDEQFDAVGDGTVDVALVRGPFFDDRTEIRPLFTEPRLMCFSTAHPLAERESLAVDDVLDFPMLQMVRTPREFRDFWQLNEARGGPPPRSHADSAVSLLEVASTLVSSNVVMPVGSSAWRLELQSPLLRALPLHGVASSDVAVAYPNRQRNPYAVAFADCAREVCERQLALVPNAELLPV
jgi:DNA-binding transcriptional LysR family regulator